MLTTKPPAPVLEHPFMQNKHLLTGHFTLSMIIHFYLFIHIYFFCTSSSQYGLGSVMAATKASAGLPQAGDEYDFYRSFPGFQNFCSVQGGRLLHWYVRTSHFLVITSTYKSFAYFSFSVILQSLRFWIAWTLHFSVALNTPLQIFLSGLENFSH